MHRLKNTDGLNTEGQRAWHGLRQRADLSGRLRWFLDGSWSEDATHLSPKFKMMPLRSFKTNVHLEKPAKSDSPSSASPSRTLSLCI